MDLETSIACPSCTHIMKIKMRDMVPGKKKRCTSCNADIVFSKEDGRKSQQALADLNKSKKNRFG